MSFIEIVNNKYLDNVAFGDPAVARLNDKLFHSTFKGCFFYESIFNNKYSDSSAEAYLEISSFFRILYRYSSVLSSVVDVKKAEKLILASHSFLTPLIKPNFDQFISSTRVDDDCSFFYWNENNRNIIPIFEQFIPIFDDFCRDALYSLNFDDFIKDYKYSGSYRYGFDCQLKFDCFVGQKSGDNIYEFFKAS